MKGAFAPPINHSCRVGLWEVSGLTVVEIKTVDISGGSVGKEYLQCRRPGLDPWAGKIPWRRTWPPTPVFLPGECYGQRSLVGCSPRGHRESVTFERLNKDKRWGETEPQGGAWLQGSPALETAPGVLRPALKALHLFFLDLEAGVRALNLRNLSLCPQLLVAIQWFTVWA